MSHYLSKSDFKLASNCPTKLYYKKSGYPTSNDDNEYLEFLAEGGYLVGKMATLMYPDGIEIDTGGDHDKAIELTREHLKQKNVVLFEASILSKGKLVRIDILEKKGNTINLIEVKSKSWNSEEPDFKDLKDYIEDVSYQYHVLTEAYPEFKVKPFLYLPDKSQRAKLDGLNLLFKMEEKTQGRFKGYSVQFDDSKKKEILKEELLTLVDVKEQVEEMLPDIKKRAKLFLKSLTGELTKMEEPITKSCFGCEYTTTDQKHPISGYQQCWKGIPEPKYHVKDLYYVGTIGGNKNPLVNDLIAQRKISLFDIPLDSLTKKRGERQLIQIEYTRKNQEWISPDLTSELRSWNYPLHFIDFETCTVAVPFHKGMRPYETIAFQWSCHTIEKPGAEPVHHEWLSLEPGFPNFQFAESLMKHVSLEGTFLMWATHENTTLRTILHQMEEYGYSNQALKKWLKQIVKMDSEDEGKFIDMNKLTLDFYFHPLMKGRTSIKKVLPAVLSEKSSKRIIHWLDSFEKGLSLKPTKTIIDPYKLLPPLDLYEKAETIKDGTGAMRAYEDLLIGINMGNEEIKKKYAEGLLRYCKLDTLAMVIIWEHWK